MIVDTFALVPIVAREPAADRLISKLANSARVLYVGDDFAATDLEQA